MRGSNKLGTLNQRGNVSNGSKVVGRVRFWSGAVTGRPGEDIGNRGGAMTTDNTAIRALMPAGSMGAVFGSGQRRSMIWPGFPQARVVLRCQMTTNGNLDYALPKMQRESARWQQILRRVRHGSATCLRGLRAC